MGRSGLVAWVLALAAGVAALAAVGYRARDADSRLYAEMGASTRLRRLAVILDRPWVPAAVWTVTFAAHLFAGRLGLPTVKLWAPGP